jgi:hypothetical protein
VGRDEGALRVQQPARSEEEGFRRARLLAAVFGLHHDLHIHELVCVGFFLRKRAPLVNSKIAKLGIVEIYN